RAGTCSRGDALQRTGTRARPVRNRFTTQPKALTMLSRLLTLLLVASFHVIARPATPPLVAYKIVTASERGTYIQIGRDLAKFVAPDAEIELEVLPSVGSAENVQRLRYEPGVRFALVQSDVYQAFLDQASAGNAEAGAIIK